MHKLTTKHTNHCKDIRVVGRPTEAFALVQVRPVEDPGNSQTIIPSKGVDNHGASSIPTL